jgi:alkanesulfonate monooxygenase SsuD/methylene tetrahydromethanopterin reductase-like flavin-dependent oxidoreductase (luciferase family)
VGPRPNAIPLLIGGNGPKGQRHAALHADIWSSYAEERAHVDELGPRLATFDAMCEHVGRDPGTIGRGAGLPVNPLQPAGFREGVISGSPDEIADALRSFRDAGFTQVDLMLGPGTIEAIDAMAPVLERIRAD